MKISPYILFLLTLFGCQKVEKPDLDGHWAITYEDGRTTKVYDWEDLHIQGDSIRIEDKFGFREEGTYQINEDSIYIDLLNSENWQGRLEIISKDSILLDNLTFYKRADSSHYYSDFSIQPPYELIGIKTDNKIKVPVRKWTNYVPIHLFLNKNGEIQIRSTHREIFNLDYLHLILATSCNVRHPIWRVPLIFIGKGVTLKELYKVLKHIAYYGHRRTYLVLDKDKAIGYHIFSDRTNLWQEEINQLIKDKVMPPLPPQPPGNDYKKYYLGNNYKTIVFNSINDLKTIEELNVNGKYIISINQDISIKSYVILQETLRKQIPKKNIKFRTEIIETNPIN